MRLLLTTAIITSFVAPAYAGATLKDRAGTVSYAETSSTATKLNDVSPSLGYKAFSRGRVFTKGYGKNSYEERIYLDDLRKIEATDTGVDKSIAAPSNTLQPQTIYTPPPVIQPAETTLQPKQDRYLKPRVEGNWRYSNDRSILMSEFWVPLAQNSQDGSVLFGDVRIMGDNNRNREFNIGAGYRELINSQLLGDGIVGGMLWFDRRFTKRGSKFNQITAGAEWLGEKWDVRANGYAPLNDSKTHTQGNPNGSGAGFVGNQILVNTDQSVVEEALPGIDLEVGRKLGFMDGITDVTRAYVGGYHFEGDRT